MPNPPTAYQDDFMFGLDSTILGIEEMNSRISPLGMHTETHKALTKRSHQT